MMIKSFRQVKPLEKYLVTVTTNVVTIATRLIDETPLGALKRISRNKLGYKNIRNILYIEAN